MTIPNSPVSLGPNPASPLASLPTITTQLVSPVKIPTHWRPDTLKCIKLKSMSTDSRNDIVRTLVSMMMSKVGAKPTRGQCQQVARDLILKYPFMKDDIGDGYVRNSYQSIWINICYLLYIFLQLSWVEKMVERIRNVNKADKKKSIDTNGDHHNDEGLTPPKRKRKLIVDDLS